jgi:hypothetical protein
MFLWRWDGREGVWRAVPMAAGEAVGLGPRVLALPLTSGGCGLLVEGRVTVNGVPALPLRVLQDRDEIRVDDESMYFSIDGPADLVPFSGASSVRCGRCQGPMHASQPAVQCPRCQAWHHQTPHLPCWTYGPQCSGCDRPTAGAAWRPAPLASATSRKGDLLHG